MTQIFRMRGANGHGVTFRKYEEILFPDVDFVDPKLGIEYARDFQYRKGDIILSTFPKSGTHWLGSILWKLKSPDPADKPRDTVIEFGPPETYEMQKEPRIMFTHFKPDRLYPERMENKAKVVLLLRNPKDVAVSYYYHLQNAKVYKSQQTWDEYLESFLEGELIPGSYLDHLRQWEQLLKDKAEGKSHLQLEVFYFEDILLKPKEETARLNDFLKFDRDDEYLDRVVKETSIDALRQHYDEAAKKLVNPFTDDEEGRSIIFRKGQVGDWKNHFTVVQSEAMDKILQETLQHGFIKFKYEL